MEASRVSFTAADLGTFILTIVLLATEEAFLLAWVLMGHLNLWIVQV